MTQIVLDEDIRLSKNHFSSVEELYEVLYEEILERKMQYAKKNEVFVDF